MSDLSVLSQWASDLKRNPNNEACNSLNTMGSFPGGVLN